ncbi:MAG: hypothetical protein DHS20C15_29970 [Planctomycetota bacterium]|nr:MAG: hypothetical protein DHS20C15_29970 [Planctomycetota bacterium]
MSWTLLIAVVLVLGLALATLLWRRAELARLEAGLAERREAVQLGTHKARLQHPVIDLSRCLGCSTCLDVCPEDDVLQMLHGQAAVVNGARCAGVGACARECPVGAISLTLADLDERRDIPVLDPALESPQRPGLFLAGEVTAHALIKTAVEHGTRVAAEVARRVRGSGSIARAPEPGHDEQLDLCIVGAGPAGLACALEASRHGLRFAFIDQEDDAGGTVARYPRRKLVLTQPVELPLHGKLGNGSYLKEELVDLWQGLVRQHELPLRGGRRLEGLELHERGGYRVRTQHETIAAANVCLALGRRGTPVKLGVPGEDLPKVAYALLDAQSYRDRQVLVVGGGDSAVEAALALAEQPGNDVTLSYRRETFTRIRSRNAARLQNAEAAGALRVVRCSEVTQITDREVRLAVEQGDARRELQVPNTEVFVMAGGVPPFALLERAGVSFDPADRDVVQPVGEQGTGLVRALSVAFALSLVALGWAVWHSDYYLLPAAERPAHFKHQLLRPGRALGLDLGLVAVGLVALNLAYLLRRALVRGFRFASLRTWMTGHVATGILALLCALLHAGMAPRDTVGGHAFWVLAALLLTGAVGRYVYSWVPRAANGRELELDELRGELGRVEEIFPAEHADFARDARREVLELMHARQWRGNLFGRVVAFFGVQWDLWRVQARITERARAEGVPDGELRSVLHLARRSHRAALLTAHVEDLRGLLAAWRYLHRWGAALLVLLIALHVLYALTYGEHVFQSRDPLL